MRSNCPCARHHADSRVNRLLRPVERTELPKQHLSLEFEQADFSCALSYQSGGALQEKSPSTNIDGHAPQSTFAAPGGPQSPNLWATADRNAAAMVTRRDHSAIPCEENFFISAQCSSGHFLPFRGRSAQRLHGENHGESFGILEAQ